VRFLPDDFEIPTLVETSRFRIRPITIHDVVKDYDAVMTSAAHLRATLPLWGWPPDDLTLEQDLIDLGWHQKEFQLRSSFDYAVMSLDEQRLLGCVYVDPAEKQGAEAEITFWVRADELDTGLESELEATVRQWIAEVWPFKSVAYPGRDVSWAAWDALPDRQLD
jgi:hypothetical protein